jgi:hypothetical protein
MYKNGSTDLVERGLSVVCLMMRNGCCFEMVSESADGYATIVGPSRASTTPLGQGRD